MNKTYLIKHWLLTVCILLLPYLLPAQDQTVNNGAVTSPVNFPAGGCLFKWTNNIPGIGLAASGTGNIPAFTAINNGPADITATITITPSATQYAYVGNPIENKLWAIDVTTGTIAKTLNLNGNAFGVAVSPDGSRIYTTSNNSGKVTVIDAQTFTVITEIQIGTNLAAVVASPDGSKLYVVDGTIGTGHLAVINTSTFTVTNINVGPQPFGIALNADGSKAYVTFSGAPGGIKVVNTTDNSVTTIPIAEMTNAGSLCFSPDGNRLYVLTPNTDPAAHKITVYDTSNPATMPIAFQTSFPNGEQPYSVSKGPGNNVLISINNKRQVWMLASTTGQVLRIFQVGDHPVYAAIDPSGSNIYVTTSTSNGLWMFGPIPGSHAPVGPGPDYFLNKIPLTFSTLAFGNFVAPQSVCNSPTITYNIKIKATGVATPIINAYGDDIPPLNTTYGQPTYRPGEIFVSGQLLTAAITVTAPFGFEISTNGINYGQTATVNGTGNTTPSTVYVRLSKTTPAGNNYMGDVVFSSQNANNVLIPIPSSTVSKTLLIIKPDNKTRIFGAGNPAFTATYSGFVNNEDISQLIIKPIFSTTADINSPPGIYPINVSGAVAANYSFNYQTGALTIAGSVLEPVIPNTFTPNGDGINDTWEIQNLDMYSNFSIKIYNRNGQNIYSANKYPEPWNGTYNGAQVPVGTYYYVINLNNGSRVLSGNVNIIR